MGPILVLSSYKKRFLKAVVEELNVFLNHLMKAVSQIIKGPFNAYNTMGPSINFVCT